MPLKQTKELSNPNKKQSNNLQEVLLHKKKILSLEQYWREELHTAFQAVPQFHRHVD